MNAKGKQNYRSITRTEIIETIKKLTAQLGEVPTKRQLVTLTAVKQKHLRRHFNCFSSALNACGMENPHTGVRLTPVKLFEDWAGVARTLKRLPSRQEYRKLGNHSVQPLLTLAGHWSGVAQAMLDCARQNRLDKKWKDVMALIAQQAQTESPGHGVSWRVPARRRGKLLKDRPVYGPPMTRAALLHVPTNESAVMFLFASLALELGFMATIVRTSFPDCEALREISPNRLQRVRIEFEYLAKNFVKHRHRLDGADIIVCWINNWPECPLEVIELSRQVGKRPC